MAATLKIVLPAPQPSAQEHAAYFPQLLRLALEKTEGADGPFEIKFFGEQMSSPRQIAELRKRNGAINVIWDGTDRRREAELLPIRISLLHQLNDYRVFLIRQEDRAKFAAIRSLDELRRLQAGAGLNWPSTDVLRANRLPVVTSAGYELLFPMLRAGRFDYMPRGVSEIWDEQQQHAAQGLAVEETILLHYPLPFYFFVHRDNTALAGRIERGLRIAQADGSFDTLFNSFRNLRRGLEEVNAGRRRVFELKMP